MNLILRSSSTLIITALTLFSCSKEKSSEPSSISASNFEVSIDENPVDGETLGTLNANTNQGTLSFNLVEESIEGALKINQSTGELTVLNSSLFDYEVVNAITGIYQVTAGDLSESAIITININDDPTDAFVGDIVLDSQEAIETFGANNYNTITGSLTIGSPYNIKNTSVIDLTPLSSLTSIGRDVKMSHNAALLHLDGLDNIVSIGGDLWMVINYELQDMSHLSSLSSIGGDFYFSGQFALTDLNGLQNLKTINGSLRIEQNYDLTDLSALDGLENIGGFIYIWGNQSLQNLNGFNTIVSLADGIKIEGNEALEVISGFENLNTTRNLIFQENINLEVINGFGVLSSVNDILTFAKNNSLQNFNQLTSINSVGRIYIRDNENLTSLEGLSGITSAVTNVYIEDNNALNSLFGFNNISMIEETIEIKNNAMLQDLEGLNGLINVGESAYIYVNNNQTLTDFCALENLMMNIEVDNYYASNNAYNPTRQDIIDGNCSL